ncbi:MAG: MFS transporter [Thermodesulfovibrio sp.]|jgi:MFS family permease|uniref:MFS transporter n=1 Tax=unclassified Thermodesulfovibrio TaxID=2645936 RepID=UPI00083AB9C6|nr:MULTISPECIES: MFS transporter [unclassified Thermodesulfovibrio]MDI1472367.1 MFS transporter [Thermodesulfovibrio sp. 1176]MDI6714232.1 MFS transporter [Thermodesulfovibrio sp.]ODA43954.1 Permease of the major facilitator superfamily [Thermodesulfovibrio sp. N1]
MKQATLFIVLLGFVSLFADMTYEAARSITGPFLLALGATGTLVGFISGLGEFLGYALRIVSGWIADKTGKYWSITIVGYLINLLSVPALALVGQWQIAAVLIMAERIGKAVRNPSRDAMLSHATVEIGRGWGFGLHEAMDQIGAMLGPLIIAGVFYFHGGYREAFGILLIPAVLAFSILIFARFLYPSPKDLEISTVQIETKGLSKVYWIYLVAVALNGAGYADFPLIAYHFKKVATVSEQWIPVFYAIAMGVDALAALLFGYLFDKKGLAILIFSVIVSAGFAPLCFLGGFYEAVLGMILWGIGMGAQESVMRAAVALLVPKDKRGVGYGLFNTGYGFFWFLGSTALGLLYDFSISTLIVFSVLLQLSSIPFLIKVRKMLH